MIWLNWNRVRFVVERNNTFCGEDRFKGLDADICADWEPPYCPNCGAKMDLVDDNDTL